MDVTVAAAPLAHIAEQRSGFTLAGETCELVDRRDHEGRRESVDLLIDRQDRQAFGDLTALGERAPSQLVAAAVIGVPHHGQRWI